MTESSRDTILEELRTKYGTVFTVDLPEGEWIAFRPMNRIDYRAFKKNRMDDARKIVADEELAKAVVVYPDRVAFEALLDRMPALATMLQAKILEAGGGAELEAKKE